MTKYLNNDRILSMNYDKLSTERPKLSLSQHIKLIRAFLPLLMDHEPIKPIDDPEEVVMSQMDIDTGVVSEVLANGSVREVKPLNLPPFHPTPRNT